MSWINQLLITEFAIQKTSRKKIEEFLQKDNTFLIYSGVKGHSVVYDIEVWVSPNMTGILDEKTMEVDVESILYFYAFFENKLLDTTY